MSTSFALRSGRGRNAVVVERTSQERRYEHSGRRKKAMKMRRRWRMRWDFVVVRDVFRRERESSIVVWAVVEGVDGW